MAYFKYIVNGYILYIGKGNKEIQITEGEYNKILDIIHNKPQAPEGHDYMLKENLEWELIEVEEVKDGEFE